VKMRRIPVRQIAVFAQQDDLGDAGFAGVAKAYRALGINDNAILRLNYPRNTIEVDEAVNLLRVQKLPVRAITCLHPIGPLPNSSRRRATSIPR
jgi:branched-chain amino acid transport system substrate-binding protein